MFSSSISSTLPAASLSGSQASDARGGRSSSQGASLAANEDALHSAEQTLAVEILSGDAAAAGASEAASTSLHNFSVLADGSALDAWPTSMSLNLVGGGETALSPDAQAQTAQMRNALLAPTSDGSGSLLEQLTNGEFSPSNPPDYLQVTTGSDVTPTYSGYGGAGWNGDGASVTFFTTGQQPDVTKGFAIRYAPDASPEQRQSALSMAQSYLNSHKSDSQKAAGAWNQPLFDVTVR